VGTFSFKSVGKTPEQKLVEKIESTKTPIGIKTPLRLNYGDGEILVTYYSLAETVHDNLKNLILTNWGERLGLYNFGANLKPLMTELVSQDDFDTAAIERIGTAVSKWMPYVSLDNYTSVINRNDNRILAKINIQITYNVPTLNVTNKLLEINLYAM
jgi:phage baseplate assembly protein W